MVSMNRRSLHVFTGVGLLWFVVQSQAQVVSGNRLSLEGWRNAGYPGTIPSPDFIVNVKSYGALGDGSACDGAVSSAVSALGGGPGVVFFPAGTYLLQNNLTLPYGVVFRGERATNTTLRFSCDNNCITVSGSLSGDAQAITSGYTNHSSVLMVPTGSVFQAGDFVEIKESNDPGYSWSTWAGDTVGQMASIQSVSGNQLTLQTPLRLDYQASLTPKIQKSVPTTQVGFENLKFERLNGSNYVTDNKMTILFDRAADCWVRGCEFYNGFGGHVGFYVSTRIDITGNDFHHAFSYSGGGNGYGVRLESRTGEVLVENNLFYSLRHSILFQVGANGNVVAYNYSYAGAAGLSDITMHGNFPFANLIEGNICEFIHLDNSHYESGPHNTFLRNLCTKNYFLYSAGLIVGESGTDLENFVGNEAGGYSFSGTGHVVYANNINGTAVTAGTTNLPDVSYYLGTNVTTVTNPDFWFITNGLPTIGYPQTYSTNKTLPCKYRKDQGLSRTVAPPSLWQQPSNVSVAIGTPLTLSVQATGTPVAAFAWYKGGQALGSATTAVYQVGAAQAGDGGTYRCVVSDSYGAVSSRLATVNVTGGGGTNVVPDSWVAFNDTAWLSGEVSNRITLYTYNLTGGPLTDYNAGTQLTARVDITTNEALSPFWVADATPLAGSDADFYFTGRVDPRGYLQGFVTLGFRFSNLNTASVYSCVLFGNRGPVYTDRFTDVTLSDATSFENHGSVGSQTLTGSMAGDTTRILVGSNSMGQVYRYSNIVPGSDGDFALTITRALGGNAYLNAFMIAAGTGDLLTDGGSNGMPDSWEVRYFGSTNAVQGAPNADPDGDGFSNADEYRAGTDPGNAGSVLAVGTGAIPTNGITTLSWSSVPGKIYSVQAATNLVQPWTVLQSAVTASPPTNVVSTPTTNLQQFIRVKVE